MNKNTTVNFDRPDFAALFAADLPVRRIPFTVAGQEAWVELRPMDAESSQAFSTAGLSFRFTLGQQAPEVERVDQAERSAFLVGHTLVGWQLWTRTQPRDGAEPGWQQSVPPDGFAQQTPEQRAQIIRQQLKCSPEFWNWLAAQCLRVNGLDGEQAKN